MPNFNIPFVYRQDLLRGHRVVAQVGQMTGGVDGDVVVWSQQPLRPLLVMYPNLSDSAGSVVAMLLVRV